MALVFFVSKLGELIVTPRIIGFDEVSAAAEELSNTRERYAFQTLGYTFFKSSERVITVRASISFASTPIGLNWIQLTMVLGQE